MDLPSLSTSRPGRFHRAPGFCPIIHEAIFVGGGVGGCVTAYTIGHHWDRDMQCSSANLDAMIGLELGKI